MPKTTNKRSAHRSLGFSPDAPLPTVPSSWWAALLAVFLIWVGASLVATIIVLLATVPPGSGKTPSEVLNVPAEVVLTTTVVTQALIAAATLVYVGLRAKQSPLPILGFRSDRRRPALTALLGGIAGAAVLEVLLRLVVPTAWRPEHPFTTAVQEGASVIIGLVFVSGVVFAPLVEEAVFRGYLMTAFVQRFGFVTAALVSSVAFGLAHLTFSPVSAGFAFALGLVLCWVYKKSGSLWLSVLIHAATNAVAFTIALG